MTKTNTMQARKDGNSIRLTLPQNIIKELNIKVGDFFKMEIENNRLVVIPAQLIIN